MIQGENILKKIEQASHLIKKKYGNGCINVIKHYDVKVHLACVPHVITTIL